jgi:release factor H-coupled RctB family protein
MTDAHINIINSDPARIDPMAIDQLHHTARLPGIERIVGLPDLHAGRGIAVGAAFWSPDRVYPHLVGSDIGCGMALFESSMKLGKFKPDKVEKALTGLDNSDHPDGLGTIGGGNHFAEFLKVEKVSDTERFEAFGFASDHLWLMVHSGSRGLGQAILNDWLARYGSDGALAGSEQALAYLTDHNHAIDWAVHNREVIAERFCDKLSMSAQKRLDICHNSVTAHQNGWLHRKGAAPADRGLVVVPGSRGHFTYLVEPLAEQADTALYSLAHGAGRKWARNDAHARLSKRYRPAELARTALGSRVICEDKRLIFEEAPEAYKDITHVIADLEEAQLIRVIAIFRPLLTYKTRRT